MRFFSSSAFASAEKLRLAANCSAAETITRLRCRPHHPEPIRPIWASGSRFARLWRGGEDLHRPPCLLDGGNGRFRRSEYLEGDLGRDLARAKEPHTLLGAAENAGIDQHFHRHGRADIELPRVDCGLHTAEIDLVKLA